MAPPVQPTDEPCSADTVPPSPKVLATFNDYRSLILALSAAREFRQMSFEAMDELCGSARGYWSKVLAPNGTRRVTMESLGDGFSALAVDGRLVLNEAEWDRIKHRVVPRKEFQAHGGSFSISFSGKFMKRIGKKGGQARMQQLLAKRRLASTQSSAAKSLAKSLSQEQRTAKARRAALIRWDDVKRAARASLMIGVK
jgi:hypothetical protein